MAKLVVIVFNLILMVDLIGGQMMIADKSSRERFTDKWLTDTAIDLIQRFRIALVDAKVDQLPVEDIDWTVNGNNLIGAVYTTELTLTGLTGFNVTNLTTSVVDRKVNVELELPFIQLSGNYQVGLTIFGIPLWGHGQFSIRCDGLDAGGGVELVASENPLPIVVSNPSLKVRGMTITLDGFLSDLSLIHVVLILLGLFILLVIFIILLILYFRKRGEKK